MLISGSYLLPRYLVDRPVFACVSGWKVLQHIGPILYDFLRNLHLILKESMSYIDFKDVIDFLGQYYLLGYTCRYILFSSYILSLCWTVYEIFLRNLQSLVLCSKIASLNLFFCCYDRINPLSNLCGQYPEPQVYQRPGRLR